MTLEEQKKQQQQNTSTGTYGQGSQTLDVGKTAGNAAAGSNTAGSTQPAVQVNGTGMQGNTNLYGISDASKTGLQQYGGAYQQSSAVTDAQNMMNQMQQNMQSAYSGMEPYLQQLQQLNQSILNGDRKFNYDVNGDQLYQAYRDQYMQNGKQAMLDAQGAASALTGGYGNSYGANAGSQAYQQYLGQMNDRLLDTYDRAYQRWGDQLGMEQNAAAASLDAQRGLYNDAMSGMGANMNVYNSLYGNENSAYRDAQNYYMNLANMENSSAYNDRNYYYNLAALAIAKGNTPSEDILKKAGLSKADAQKLAKQNVQTAVRPTTTTPANNQNDTKSFLERLTEATKYLKK